MTTSTSSAPWWRRGVIYQIWPRSFADGDGDGVGDLRGIVSRLDYLNDGEGGGLGVDGIWLSPIFVSPLADFGYDISDYTAVDPMFGTIEDLDLLVSECHRRGVRVLLDLVPNHTSDQHPWFVESRASRHSSKRDWYRWRDPAPDGGPPNNWRSAFGAVGAAWTLDPETGQYYHHSYSVNQPDLNWDNPEVRAAVLEVVRFWFERGIDGFRIDVAHRLGKDPEYGDNPDGALDIEPTAPGRHDADWPTTLDYLRQIREVADDFGDRLLVGEVYILDQSRVIDYLRNGDGLHLAHNFVFMAQPWAGDHMAPAITGFELECGPQIEPSWCLNNHDHSRVRSRFDGDGRGDLRARSAALVLLALRGTIFIYQGEELGLPDSVLPAGAGVDIDGRDGSRTPIPWGPPSRTGVGAGFSDGTPWLPLGSTAETTNVEVQEGDPGSMLELYRQSIRLRHVSPALRDGGYRQIMSDGRVLVFERRTGEECVVVMVNFTPEPVELPELELSGRAEPLLSSVPGGSGRTRWLDPLETRWLQIVPQKTTETLASGHSDP